MAYKKNGAEYIGSLIDKAIADGKRCAVIDEDCEIEKTVIIPSDFTLVIRDAKLRLADDTFCNMFRNTGCDKELRSVNDPDRNINIVGEGNAVLDGGTYNGLSERNSLKDGRPHISVNNTLLFVNVDGFSVTGLKVINQRWWGLNFIACSHGLIRDIDFCSSDITVNADGTYGHGFSRKNGTYESILVKNSDGIDLRCGCHDILIEHITGFTEDDTVALTALPGKLCERYKVDGAPMSIHGVTIRDVQSAAFCANVRLLNQGGTKLYNILIDGVNDASEDSPYMDFGGHGVRVGDTHMYGSRHSEKGETFNITIRNVYSRAHIAVGLAGAIVGLTLDNINGYDTNNIVVDNQAQVW